MYDTETRVCLVKQRVAEKRRRQEWRGIYRAVCLVHDTVPVSCENGGRSAGAADGGSGDVRYNPAA